MKLLTITVPCYNSAGYMRKCLDSLLILPELVEIIVINDGSTDETGKIADEYAANHPDCVIAVHQENGGHGEGINQGIRRATGKYFKVVDSDDWLDETSFRELLRVMKNMDERGEKIDLYVCNYVYELQGGGTGRTVQYRNALDNGKILTWDKTRRFNVTQYITLHSGVFRTEMLKNLGIDLPKKVSYDDNLYAYLPMPYINRMLYLDLDLYRYLIGRDGQSVAEEVLVRKALQHGEISWRIFKAYDLKKVKAENKRLWNYMYHEVDIMLTIGSVILRMNGGEAEEAFRKKMWRDVMKTGSFRLKFFSMAAHSNIPGKLGKGIAVGGYRLAHLFLKFN